MCVKALYFLAVLFGLAASGVLRVSGMRVYTSGDVEAVNGTDVRLRCTFSSSASINPNSIVISWSFRPLKPGRQESVFHWQQKPYYPQEGLFRKRVQWAGDVMASDASIILTQVKFTYNGTYVCQVKNPPDVHGTVGEVKLLVVTTASFSDLVLMMLAIGGGITAVVLLLVLILSCRRCRKRHHRDLGAQEGSEEAPPPPIKERKDPTACHPSRAIHLYMSQTSLEIDSSDGMISDASTAEESSSSDEEPSSDEDEDGDDSD